MASAELFAFGVVILGESSDSYCPFAKHHSLTLTHAFAVVATRDTVRNPTRNVETLNSDCLGWQTVLDAIAFIRYARREDSSLYSTRERYVISRHKE